MERIKHEPLFDTKKVEELYTQKDGVAVKYVCTSAPNEYGTYAADIFYRETPHPEFGNRYFGLFNNHMGQIMITNADMIEDLQFAMIEDNNGDLHYSAHRHDYKVIDDKMIDGGRSYIKTNADTLSYRVKDGEFYVCTIR